MHLLIKAVLSLAIIFAATGVAKRFPSAAGLIAVMPLTGALVMVWVYLETGGNPETMRHFTKGALWGILPSIIFFLVAFLCFRRQLSLPVTLLSSFLAWCFAALIHQLAVR